MARPALRRYFRHGLLPQLIAFDACLRHGSVTRAAQELALAQPTVSGLLKKLAEAIGKPIVRFRGGSAVLTGAGRELAALCDEVLPALERFERRQSAVRTTAMIAASAATIAAGTP